MKTNLQFFLNTYADSSTTTTPSQNNFRWLREINGISYNIENDQQIQVPISGTSPNIAPYPFSTATASPSSTLNSTTSVTVASPTSISVGQLIVGTGIPVGTTVVSITGSVVVMSQAATTSGVEAVSFYSPASFVYLESDQPVSVIYNNGSPMAINPFLINGRQAPGVFFMNGPCYQLTVKNLGTGIANVFMASMG
jgi:hypothetical protein